MKNKIIFLQLFFAIIIFTNCKKTPKCETPLDVNQSSIQVIFKDRTTGKYLYEENIPLFNKDSIKVFDPNGSSLYLLYTLNLIPSTPNRYWEINFGPIYNNNFDANSFNSELCKDFIVKYGTNQFDTIKTCFKANKTECGSVFEYLKIYNKGQLISTNINQANSLITIIKN